MKKKLGNISHGKPSAGMNPLKASQLPNNANIRTDVEETKSNLKQLANRYIGVTEVKGFLTDLWKALGIDAVTQTQQKGGNPSRYAAFQLQDGRLLIVTVRASVHNTDAATFAEYGNINGDMNLSLVIRKRGGTDTFKPDDEVRLEEYVYIEHRIKNPRIQNPLSQIALSLVGYLTNGVYIDTTGIAIKNISPIPQPEEEHLSPNELIQQWNHTVDRITENKTYKNMKKNVQRINESQLRAIVAESVKKVLKEGVYDDKRIYQIMSQAFNELIKAHHRLYRIQDSKGFSKAYGVIHDALGLFHENGFNVSNDTSENEPPYMDGAGNQY